MPPTPTRSNRSTPEVTALAGLPPGAVIHVPSGGDPLDALACTTDLGVVAHPDDLELLCCGPVLDCRDDPGRSFTGIVCTDGAGSVRPPGLEHLDREAWVATRLAEQVASADLARMGAVVVLGLPSDGVTGRPDTEGRRSLLAALDVLVQSCSAAVVHTHEPTDPHRTHRAVATAVIGAVRTTPAPSRPQRLFGWEGWRSLDWLDVDHRHVADLTGRLDDAAALARCHASQLAAKRYDDAVIGRWRANATFASPRTADDAEAVALAWDLSPLLAPEVDVSGFVANALATFVEGASEDPAGSR